MQEKIFYNDKEIEVTWNKIDPDVLILTLKASIDISESTLFQLNMRTPIVSILTNVERINAVTYKFKNVKEDLPTYKDLNIFLEKRLLRMYNLLTLSFNEIL